MNKIAFVFPGQGAQYVGMAKDFYDNFEESKLVFDKAAEVLDIDVKHICFDENEDINITEYTQPVMVTACVAILKHIEALGIKPSVCAGLSLGEYCALVASGVIDFEDAVTIVRKRGILMQNAVPTGKGAMAAVLGMDSDKINKFCEEVNGIVSIANYNCPGQIVITGEKTAVEEAAEKLKENGARRVVMLNVSGPFHSQMLEEAGCNLLKELDKVSINNFSIPYVANATAQYVTDRQSVKSLLGRQVYSSVKMEQSIEEMIKNGVDTFVEIGPGRTISGFIKKINKEVTVVNIDKVEDLDKLSKIE